jgi:hypothetical protein
MNDRIKPLDILRCYPADVLGECEWARMTIVVKPAIAVKAAINPDNIEPPLQQPRPENGANISVDTGNQYPHSGHVRLVRRLLKSSAKFTL